MITSLSFKAILFSLILLTAFVFAQHQVAQNKNKNQILIKHYNVKDGLSDNYVTSIVQDKYRFLWIGTDEGLNRFDGYEFKVFKADDFITNGLRDDKITCLFKDRSGNLWIGTSGSGIYRYNYNLERFQNWDVISKNSSPLSYNSITSIAQNDDDKLWIGTNGGGLNFIDISAGVIKYFKYDPDDSNSLDEDYISALFVDSGQKLWVGTHNGINLFNKNQNNFTRYDLSSLSEQGTSSSVGTIYQDVDGKLWLGTTFGLVYFNPLANSYQKWQIEKSSVHKFESNRITSIASTKFGDLFVGSLSGELYKLNNGNLYPQKDWRIIFKEDGNHSINNLFMTENGILWIGTAEGLYKIIESKNVFNNFIDKISPQRLTSDYAWPIYEDKDGVIWIGTISGLNSYDPSTNEVKNFINEPGNPSSISDNSILSIYEDSKNSLWVGTFRGGINRLNKDKGTFLHWKNIREDPTTLPNNLVDCILEDEKGTIWMGTAKGLARFDEKNNKVMRITSEDKQDIINNIYICDMLGFIDGGLWITTLRNGLILFDPQEGTIKHWQHNPGDKNSLSSNALTDILEIKNPTDQSNTFLVIGTEGGGICIFDYHNEIFKSYSVNDGLADSKINSMIEDDNGIIWLGGENGLTWFNPVDNSVKIFDERDGIPDPFFNSWSAMKSRTGLLYFGTRSGIICFDPKVLSEDKTNKVPDVVFTGIELFNKPVELGESSILKKTILETSEIELEHDQNIFALTFAVLDFEKPEKNIYAYKIEGLNDDWIEIGTRRRVDFTGMDPGEYILKVKAASSKGIWANISSAIKITINPPYWETWWFRVLVAIIIFSLFYLAYRIRLGIILKEQKTRNQIARDLHDDVSATLSGITWFAKAAQHGGKNNISVKESNYNQLIIDSAVDAQEKIKDIIWAVQPELDNIGQLFAQCQRYAADLLESADIKHQIDIRPPKSSKKISMMQRQNFWLIFKEIITNSVKHSGCSFIRIKLKLEGTKLFFLVTDDGVGFDQDKVKQGNGLSNIHTRLKNINAISNLKTEPGKGVSWEIQFEIN